MKCGLFSRATLLVLLKPVCQQNKASLQITKPSQRYTGVNSPSGWGSTQITRRQQREKKLQFDIYGARHTSLTSQAPTSGAWKLYWFFKIVSAARWGALLPEYLSNFRDDRRVVLLTRASWKDTFISGYFQQFTPKDNRQWPFNLCFLCPVGWKQLWILC